ncbi:MFS general substrate transporter [Lojkania enalia]|uniref:MFS general substrate transporter n=1 Tax=Lojkania enalia TaxID=147567 RepID=A0A9P4N6U7_9PLEO|nr:MFS general substrate transporter [Didymosphaeria enalia]
MAPTDSVRSADRAPIQTIKKVNEYQDAEKNYQPRSSKFWSVIIGLYLSIFLVALDRTIIATAIPTITTDFNSIEDISWYGSAYMLTGACFNPIFGRLYQLYSTKWVFLTSIAIFEVGSALCGAAPNSTSLIIGRAIAGTGSAGIFAGGIIIMLPLVPLRKRPIFSSMFGLAFGLSSVLGPIIGGALTDHITWRWCFYINLPIGAVPTIAVLLFFNAEPPKHEVAIYSYVQRLDLVGLSLFTPSIVCLILALQWGGTTYRWSAPTTIGLLVTFAVLFVAFIVNEILTPETAIAPTRVVLNRSVAGSMTFTLLLSGGLMSIAYYLNIWFQVVKDDSAMQSGISTIPMLLSLVVMSIGAAVFTQKIGYYVPNMLFSPILCAVGAGLLSTISPSSSYSQWIGYQVLYGLGIGCGFQAPNLAVQTVLPRADVPLGMALMFFMQQLGGSIFLAVSQNVFSSKLVSRLSGIAGVDGKSIVNVGAKDLYKIVPQKSITVAINAYSYSLTRVFILSSALGACMILGPLVVEWKSIKDKPSHGDTSKSPEDDSKENENESKSQV